MVPLRRPISVISQRSSRSVSYTHLDVYKRQDQIIDLFANGIKTVHVYTMNTPDVAAKILNNLSDILG